ncbi:MAG TPA: RidA family protein [Candidatus Binatia bacterium]|nr:RidA family protein [Candidatus Binatia bacterium]
MANTIHLPELYSDDELFAQGVQAGELIFLTQDARGRNGKVVENSTADDQSRQTLENLSRMLKSVGLSLANIISMTVFLPDYSDAKQVAEVLRSTFGKSGTIYPATTLVGVCGLEANCRLRMDAIATSSRDREPIVIGDIPFALGSGSHGVRVGEFVFLSGVDAVDDRGEVSSPVTIQSQTREVLNRIKRIVNHQKLGLGDLCRTFMFMPSTEYRPGYGEARKEVYKGIFSEDEFPPNSGIYIQDLGPNILLRSVAIAHRGKKTIVTSPRVRRAPGSFSQSVRVDDWLLLAGQDAVGFNREVEAEGSLAGQTEVTLRHTKDIVEAAGGNLDDIVKTTVYLTAGQDRAEFANAYEKFFKTYRRSSTMPAGLTVEVRELSPRCLVEIDAVAFLHGR